MTTKVPGSTVLTNPSTPSTQATPSTVTSVPSSAVFNSNNNNKNSGAATSIITAPLMSQAQPANSMQKQSANNVSATTTASASPGKSVSSGVGATASAATTSASTPTPPSAASQVSGITKVGPTAHAAAPDLAKPGITSTNPPTSTATSDSSKGQPIKPSAGATATSSPSASVPLTKPTDFNKSIMNGGATVVMKQPPPPVTVLPPTPVATPPSIHRQPPTLPQVATNPPPPASNNNNTTNQKSQSGQAPPPPSSSNNNTPVKQPPSSSSTPSAIQKIQSQEEGKPTQPLPVQHQGNSTSSPAYKQGVQLKDQQAIGGNQDQKVINKGISSVTDPATLTNTKVANTSVTSSAATVPPPTPTSGTISGNNNNKGIEKPVTRPASVVTSAAVSNSPVAKNSGPSVTPAAKKMENSGATESKIPAAMEEKGQTRADSQPPPVSVNIGGGDAPMISAENLKNSAELKNAQENEKNAAVSSGNNTSVLDSAVGKKDPGSVSTEKSDASSKVDLILEKANDMNKSIYIPTSDEEPIIGKSEKPIISAHPKKKDGEIGDDVKRIMDAIESAGLCGPKLPEGSYESVHANNNAENGSKGPKPNRSSSLSNRSSTSNGTRNRSLSRPGTAASPLKGTNTSPTKSRPSTAYASSRKDHHTSNGVSGIPTLSSAKSPKEKVAPASGTGNGSPASLPPRATASGLRTSTSRAASAKVNTAPATTKTPNENKNSKAKTNGADSCSASPVETETGPSSATGSRSTPRVRPSSSLYRPTASSALKGVSSAPHNSTSNHNLPSSPSTPRTSRSSTGVRTISSAITMGDSAGGSGEGKPATLKDNFAAFARFGNKEEDGKHITLSNCDKWMKQAKVIDGKKITTTDTSICFKKLFKTAKKITFEDFKKYVEELAKSKKMEPQELLDKLANSGPPGLSSATRAAHSNVVDRLTDTSKYTGSHKERFDATGKGRGIEGRKDVPDGSGYVAAFKEKLDLKDDGKKEESPSASPTPAK